MLIYLDQYRKAKTINMAGMQRHAATRLCVNGIATASVIAMPKDLNEPSPELPDDFSAVDVSTFYNRVYALASQI